MKIIIPKEGEGIRIDKYLGDTISDLSREMIIKLIKDGEVLVNGKNVKSSYKATENDEVLINIPEPKEINIVPQDIPLNIVYEDQDILVINKQKGLVVHPGNGNEDGTLVNAIMAYCKKDLSGIGGVIRPGIVHRIDKDTSGILIIAKNDKAHLNISEQIKNHQVKKTYIALVRGIVKENEATINMPIGRSTKDRTKMAVDRNGKEAITHFSVIKRYEDMTLLKVRIETGRTHQIRVHLSHIGYPIIGDNVYSNGKNRFNIVGQMLHSYEIEFTHPTTGEKMVLKAELPEYFKEIIGNINLD